MHIHIMYTYTINRYRVRHSRRKLIVALSLLLATTRCTLHHPMMNNQTSGFDCEFVEKPQNPFQSECPVCLLVLKEPDQVDCCGYTCIERIQKDNKSCPCCNAERFVKLEDKGCN